MSYSLARSLPEASPAGLALVEGLLNTRATGSGAIDLLEDRTTAQAWLSAGLAEWALRTGSTAPRDGIAIADPRELRALRQRVLAYVAGDRGDLRLDAPISIVSSTDGALRTRPVGTGIGWLESAVWGEMFLAQQSGTLGRLKLCRNAACGSAFYDRSRNSSGVWHDVHTCGNSANLRASRARKRVRALD